jgi:hypothetical protein
MMVLLVPTALMKLARYPRNVHKSLYFKLCKWNYSESEVLISIPQDLRESGEVLLIADSESGLAKTLGISWNTRTDSFTLRVSAPKHAD